VFPHKKGMKGGAEHKGMKGWLFEVKATLRGGGLETSPVKHVSFDCVTISTLIMNPLSNSYSISVLSHSVNFIRLLSLNIFT
jgi:hypothetical protein